ncbi:hypothetical protein FKM82_023200 [Ascaphus truei]
MTSLPPYNQQAVPLQPTLQGSVKPCHFHFRPLPPHENFFSSRVTSVSTATGCSPSLPPPPGPFLHPSRPVCVTVVARRSPSLSPGNVFLVFFCCYLPLCDKEKNYPFQ